MFNSYFNDNFQNVNPDQNTDYDPYKDNYFGRNDKTPYMQGLSGMMPQPLPGNPTTSSLYPLESSLATPYLNTPAVATYSKGGKVKGSNSKNKNNPYPALAEMIRQQGNGDDTILAHINPLEAIMLKGMGGSGTINPKTGLPQFGGFFKKPWKATKSVLGGGAGAIIGNMILPGIGGVIGGALGQGVQHAARGKSFGEGALKGGAMGAFLPSAASLAGAGLGSLGMRGAGSFLSNYGVQNAILPSLGIGSGGGGMSAGGSNGFSLSNLMSAGRPNSIAATGNPIMAATNATGGNTVPGGFLDKLTANSSNFLSKPKNLLTLASVAGSFANRPKPPKEKSPETLAQEMKRYQQAMILSPQEQAAKEAAMLAEEQMKRRIERNKFLPEERFSIEPIYRKTNSPKEYKKNGRWLEYYNNPEFAGSSIPFKHGGSVSPKTMFEAEGIMMPGGLGHFIESLGGGQDDDIRMDIPENSYIIDATTVSNIGDGNSRAGAEKIKALVSGGEYYLSPEEVTHLGKGNNNKGAEMLDNMVKNIRKHKNGTIKLPPKTKSLTSYMR